MKTETAPDCIPIALVDLATGILFGPAKPEEVTAARTLNQPTKGGHLTLTVNGRKCYLLSYYYL